MADKFLDKVYEIDGSTEELYTDWAASYDAEVAEAGYATPGRCAKALASVAEDKAAPLIDVGCGTGLGGLALRLEGFETLDGLDLTRAMLDRAAERGIYRELIRADAGELPFEAGDYANAAAIGLFSPDHAPAGTIDAVLERLPRGGHFVFSLNDHALAERSYEQRIMAWTDAGAARCVFREYGEHLPARDLKSTVYVLRRS